MSSRGAETTSTAASSESDREMVNGPNTNCNINALIASGGGGVGGGECNSATETDGNVTNDEVPVWTQRKMQAFHPRCGSRITLSNGNRTAMRSVRDFSHALVFSAERLVDNVLFEVVIERKNHSWGGSIEIGVTHEPPNELELLSTATAMRNGTWVISGTEVRRNGECINSRYGIDLESLIESDRVGIMRTQKDELIVYVNGFSMGVADYNMPKPLWALVNLYGRCVQVSLYPYINVESGTALCREMSESLLQQQQSQQQHQPVELPLSIDVSVSQSASNGGNLATSTLAEAANSANLCLANVLAAACSSLPTPLLFARQQHNCNLSQQNSSGAISSSNNISSMVSSTIQQSSDFYDMNERLRFHTRCGSLVKLSTNFRSAERRRPLDEFNNGVVMTHRPLKDNELFEIRIDKLVDKWSGSIEVGVTTHNPTVLHFPATMTNMRSGTIMMSGCGILTNGKGTRRQYGEFNLDELAEGDRVGMMRKANGNLHYYINGQDQGVAATRVASTLWGVIDLYGMTIKVTIVDRDEREQQNLVTRRNNLLLSSAAAAAAAAACATTASLTPMLSLQSPELELQVNGGGDSAINALNGAISASLNSTNTQRHDDRLTFNSLCGSHARVTNNGRTALRPNASDDFNNGVVLTRRPLRPNELFQVRLERVVSKWAGSVEMGVTVYSAEELDFPFTMTNIRTGTWMMTGNGVMQNGITVIEQYGQNLDRLQVGDRVGVMRKDDGSLHFWVNGVDQGLAAISVPERVYGVIDLYGQAAQASIVDTSECGSPDTGNSTISNTSLYSEPPLRFHLIHGKNANISSNGLTASRPNSLAEFNDSIVFSNRPLRQRELFEVVLENMVRHWSGNVEIGVTGTRPEDIILSQNAADLEAPETVILCGSMLFYNRKTIRSDVPMDLDLLSVNARVGVMRNGDFIHFYINGVDQGPACELRSPNIWAIVDIYGQCAQVSLTQTQPIEIPRVAPYATSENSQSCQATSVIQPANLETKHRWTCVSGYVQLLQNWTVASRLSGTQAPLSRCLVFSEHPLRLGSPFEIRILVRNPMLAGSLSIGITDLNLRDEYVRRNLPVNIKRIPANVWYLTCNELRHNMRLLQRSATSLEWLRTGDRISLELTTGRTLRILFNSEDMNIHFKHVAKNPYVVVELHGSTMAVQAISSQAPMSPLRPCILRLQDSLDFGADPLNKQDSMLESMESEVVSLDFLEYCGKNIRLQNDNRTATRTASFNHGIVFGSKAMCKGDCISIKVDKVNPKWHGTIGIGIVGIGPLLETVAPSLLQITRRCWGMTKDYITINGQRISSNYGEALDHIQAGTLITLTFTYSNMLIITVGGTTLVEVGTLPDCGYPVFDLYGKCEQITAVVMPSNDAAALTNSISPPTTLASTVETVVTTTAASTTIAAPPMLNSVAAVVASISAGGDDSMSSLENDGEYNLSREKADLECHEKETNESYEQPTRSNTLNVRRLVQDDGDDESDDLISLHASPGCTNLHANLNRSVMESVSENLFTNLSIQIRSLEIQTRQTENNASSSNQPACRLRESLQLHHNTNYNIQRSQSNQRLQQQQQTNQNNTIGTAAVAGAAVHDTNKDYEEAMETEGSSTFEDNCLPQLNSCSESYNATNNNDIINSSRSRATTSFGAFMQNEILNDASSTTSSNNSALGGAGINGRDRTLDEMGLQSAEISNMVDSVLDCTSTSSNLSACARDRTQSIRNGSSLSDNASLISNDSFTSLANLAIASRMAHCPLRINDFLLDSSSDGSSYNESENRHIERLDMNDVSDGEDFVTIMGLNSQWRPRSPILEECHAQAHVDAIENTQSDSDSLNYADLLHNAVIRVSNILDRVNDIATRDNSPMLSGSNYDSMQTLNTLDRRDCPYLKLVKQFFSSLVLPRVFFPQSTEPLCFCSNCNISGRANINGWVYFKLDTKAANAHETPTSITEYDQYFCMYFVTRVDKIRAILDFGQLVPQDPTRDGEIHTPPSSSSTQKDEPGTRLELHFSPENEASMRKNAQLKFTHNGKKYRIGATFEVFVRHQALCSLPSNKLGECQSNRGDLHSLASVPSCTNSIHSVINSLMYGGDSSNGTNSPVHVPAAASNNCRMTGSVRNNANDVGIVPSSSNDGNNLRLTSTNSNTSFTELTWFTKEDGSCFINALVLRLEEFNGDEVSFDSLLDDLN